MGRIVVSEHIVDLFRKWFCRRTGPIITSTGNPIYALHKIEPSLMTRCLFVEYYSIIYITFSAIN